MRFQHRREGILFVELAPEDPREGCEVQHLVRV